MNEVPTKLFRTASLHGLICIASDTGNHRIAPTEIGQNWELICHQEHWLLTINGFPQIRFRHEEVNQFIEYSFHKRVSSSTL